MAAEKKLSDYLGRHEKTKVGWAVLHYQQQGNLMAMLTTI
jgi:hypothetical protein